MKLYLHVPNKNLRMRTYRTINTGNAKGLSVRDFVSDRGRAGEWLNILKDRHQREESLITQLKMFLFLNMYSYIYLCMGLDTECSA